MLTNIDVYAIIFLTLFVISQIIIIRILLIGLDAYKLCNYSQNRILKDIHIHLININEEKDKSFKKREKKIAT